MKAICKTIEKIKKYFYLSIIYMSETASTVYNHNLLF